MDGAYVPFEAIVDLHNSVAMLMYDKCKEHDMSQSVAAAICYMLIEAFEMGNPPSVVQEVRRIANQLSLYMEPNKQLLEDGPDV